MRTTGAIMVLALCGRACAWAADDLSLPVTLTVTEPAGLNRGDAEPVTTGLPFAPGVVRAGTPLALFDAGGAEVPLQTRVLAHWPDGSVKWVLLDFQVPRPWLAANGKAEFRLVAAEPKAKADPAHAVQVQEKDDSLVVGAGHVRVTLSRKAFPLFQSVTIDGGEALGAADTPALEITDCEGKTRNSIADLAPGYEVKVVEAGPIRTVVRATGEVQATGKDRLGFTCWYHFHGGETAARTVRVFLTMRNLNGKAFTQTDQQSVQDLAYQKTVAKAPGNVSVDAVDLVLRTKAAGGAKYALGGDKAVAGALDAGTVKLVLV